MMIVNVFASCFRIPRRSKSWYVAFMAVGEYDERPTQICCTQKIYKHFGITLSCGFATSQ
jgi:hypothetical protein